MSVRLREVPLYFYLYTENLGWSNQCYITPIRQIFRAWLGVSGWFFFAEWLTAKGCFAAPWRVHFLWHLIRLWIFPCQRLRIELIILEEYWFTKIKLSLGCPRKASFFIIRTGNLQRNSFSFWTVIYQLFRWIFRTWSGSVKVTFVRSAWPYDAVCCFAWSPFPGCCSMFLHIPLSKIYYDLLSAVQGSMSCFWKFNLLFFFKFYRRPKDGNFDKLALW